MGPGRGLDAGGDSRPPRLRVRSHAEAAAWEGRLARTQISQPSGGARGEAATESASAPAASAAARLSWTAVSLALSTVSRQDVIGAHGGPAAWRQYDRRVIKACLNGSRAPEEHSALPITPGQLAADAETCARLGAGAIHIHPRDDDGHQTLDTAVTDAAARAVRVACGLPIGVSTGAWIEPDVERRAALARSWSEPDFASVNLSEAGAEVVMRALLEAGTGVEAGVWSAEDAERLAVTGLDRRLTRVLVEVVDAPADAAVAAADAIEAALDGHGLTAPRLIHGEDDACWPVLRHARRRARHAHWPRGHAAAPRRLAGRRQRRPHGRGQALGARATERGAQRPRRPLAVSTARRWRVSLM